MTTQRILRDTAGLPEVTFLVGSAPTDPAPDTATVTITRGDGSAFGAPDQAATEAGVGRFTKALAPQSDLDVFTYRWKAHYGTDDQFVTTQVEVVGGYYVSLADLKAESGLGSKTDAELAEARQWFEDRAEDYCGRAFVPRYAFEVLDGTGNARIDLKNPDPIRVLSCTIDGTAQTTTGWDLYDRGFIIRDSGTFPWGRRNVAIAYEHGALAADAALREAALTAIRSRVLSDAGGGIGGGIPAGVTQLVTDAGTMTFGRPSRPFGIAEVDSVLNERRVALVG